MKLKNLFYNFVIYNRPVKKAATWVLKNKTVTRNSWYQKKYNNLLAEKMAKHERVPLRVMVENTNCCNSDCVFCPHPQMQRIKGFMDMELFQKIADQCQEIGIDYFTIYGFGEPLLDPQFVDKVRYAKSIGLKRVTTNTNASLLTPEKSRALIEAGLDEIYISFDAATAETFKKIRPALSFVTIENNIKELVRLRVATGKKTPEIVLSFVETPDNKKEVKQYIKKWKSLVDHISISIIHNWTGELSDKLGIKNNFAYRDPCRLLWTDMVISWDGRVPLCCNDYENKTIIGDVEEQSIGEIWGGERLRKIRQHHRAREFTQIAICAGCSYNIHYKSPWWVNK